MQVLPLYQEEFEKFRDERIVIISRRLTPCWQGRFLNWAKVAYKNQSNKIQVYLSGTKERLSAQITGISIFLKNDAKMIFVTLTKQDDNEN